ncbi:integral membrane protein [Hirsutella rhossiliensis]|uniref:Hemolysin-III related domain-containing protein n=1 Tax=Hirsutella rhossiliensis TaxID=111463 RepID=A0A9P8N7U2_9HYPO|nr:hemolysin-III related domain-containing protein [Hirsutella rhossiliensis]KAH0968425.1 hemolysin-III related domain-containing protein [Hirsutella rhossiliensis]
MAASQVDSQQNGAAHQHLRQRRTSTTATATEAIVHAVKTLEKKAESTLLLLWDDLPAWRRDNAFILSGYRSATRGSYAHALRSLFYLHNESVNIWSHLVGALVAASAAAYLYCALRPRYASASPADLAVFSCFFGGAVLCLGMSATFHALMDHSEEVARWGNKLDYTGIVALIMGSYVPALYYGFFCQPALLTVYLSVISLLGAGCAVVSWIETFRTPAWRPYRAAMFIGLGLSGVIPVVHAITVHGYQVVEDRMSISWVIAHGAMYIFGAVLYAVRWPERSFPGAFDIWGSSHQIFHFCVLLAAATHFCGMIKAFDHHHTVMGSQCPIE